MNFANLKKAFKDSKQEKHLPELQRLIDVATLKEIPSYIIFEKTEIELISKLAQGPDAKSIKQKADSFLKAVK